MRLTEDHFPSTSSAPAEGSAGADAAHAHLPAELERRHSEAALRDSEARFRQLFEKIPNISVQGYDAQRRVIFWNPASTELYGYSAEEVLGRALDDVLIPPELGIDIESLHRDWIEHGIEIPAGEILLRHKDGHRVPVFSSHVMATVEALCDRVAIVHEGQVVLNGTLPHWSDANRSPKSRHAYSVHCISAAARYPSFNWLQRPDLPLRGFEARVTSDR